MYCNCTQSTITQNTLVGNIHAEVAKEALETLGAIEVSRNSQHFDSRERVILYPGNGILVRNGSSVVVDLENYVSVLYSEAKG